jgi:hypothetical protein
LTISLKKRIWLARVGLVACAANHISLPISFTSCFSRPANLISTLCVCLYLPPGWTARRAAGSATGDKRSEASSRRQRMRQGRAARLLPRLVGLGVRRSRRPATSHNHTQGGCAHPGRLRRGIQGSAHVSASSSPATECPRSPSSMSK